MSWLYLLAAILFEVAGTMSMKLSDGLTKLLPSICIFVFYTICFVFMTLTLKRLEVSVAYTIWAGVGTTIIALIGMYYFGESASLLKILSIFLVIAGVVGLKLSSTH